MVNPPLLSIPFDTPNLSAIERLTLAAMATLETGVWPNTAQQARKSSSTEILAAMTDTNPAHMDVVLGWLEEKMLIEAVPGPDDRGYRIAP